MMTDIIMIADAHLGAKNGDVDKMIAFIKECNPQTTQLVFLGDLFFIWAGPQRYHKQYMLKLLDALHHFLRAGGKTYLVVGNRDILFKQFENSVKYLPFTKIANDDLTLEHQHKKLLFNHGDLVNTRDKGYIKWRKFVRHPWFEGTMNLLPASFGNKIITSGEQKIKQINHINKKSFPMEEWNTFAETKFQTYQYDYLFIGHFHPELPIQTRVQSATAIVIPDWYADGAFGKLSKGDEFTVNYN